MHSSNDAAGDAVGSTSNSGSDENLGGSLTDLVAQFDEKISQCFKVCLYGGDTIYSVSILQDYHENTDDLAPVQMRVADEAMTDSQ
jgi:hypothetical protein